MREGRTTERLHSFGATAILWLIAINLLAQPYNCSAQNTQNPADNTSRALAASDNDKTKANNETAKSGEPHWYTTAEWWVVIVAALTAGFIAWQARETRRATNAMERNTAAFIESQQAIVVCDPHESPLADLTVPNGVPRLRLALSNKGAVTAFHCRWETWIEYIPHAAGNGFDVIRDFTFSNAAIHQASSPHYLSVYPDHHPVIINVPAGRDLSDDDKRAIRQARLLVCVRLRVTFNDAFTRDRFADLRFG